MYQPALGRFISRDPIRDDQRDWNPYEYVGAQPIRAVDPSGRDLEIPIRIYASLNLILKGHLPHLRRKVIGSHAWGRDIDEYNEVLRTGCIGLCQLRIGDTEKKPNLSAGVRCFTSYSFAQIELQKWNEKGLKGTLFAVQSTVSPVSELTDFYYEKATGKKKMKFETVTEIDPSDIRLTGAYNFATLIERYQDFAIQNEGLNPKIDRRGKVYWEWIPGSFLTGNAQDVNVQLTESLPTQLSGKPVHNVYCIAPRCRQHMQTTKLGSPVHRARLEAPNEVILH